MAEIGRRVFDARGGGAHRDLRFRIYPGRPSTSNHQSCCRALAEEIIGDGGYTLTLCRCHGARILAWRPSGLVPNLEAARALKDTRVYTIPSPLPRKPWYPNCDVVWSHGVYAKTEQSRPQSV